MAEVMRQEAPYPEALAEVPRRRRLDHRQPRDELHHAG